ncbi:MAG TPA: phosphate signaling complex protein PhoU [Candidatus Dormibacteraeota bacterium]|nr:phosphate signaling complex protein PhoU [Candidatus Dormibacteraeota bacterium]
MTDVVGLEIEAFDDIAGPRLARGPATIAEPLPLRGDMRPALHDAIDGMRADLGRMTDLVVDSLRLCARAIRGEPDPAATVVAGDLAVNELHRRVRQSVLHVLTTQAPLARDLRRVVAALLVDEELERMGDHCVSIAKQCSHLGPAPASQREALARMAELAVAQVRAMEAAVEARDVHAARAVASRDDAVDGVYHSIIDGLLESEGGNAAPTVVLIAHHLERIGDRVTNVVEHLVFAVDGGFVELG